MECEANTFFGVMNAFRSINVFSLLPLSRQEYMVMFVISKKQETDPEGCTVSAVAQKMRVPQPAVSRTLRGLENNGYIQREVCRTDRRNTYVTLTETGETEVMRANQLLEEFHKGIRERFTQDEADQLMDLLRRLYAAASEELDAMKAARAACTKGVKHPDGETF